MFEVMNAEKWLWLIFGCKVGQRVPIGMKLELDMWHYLINVYTMFQIDIWKHVEKKPGKLHKIQNAKKYSPKFRKYDFCKKRNLCREVYSGPSTYQIWRIYLDLYGHDCKNWVWPTFVCKLGQSDPIVMKRKLDMLCHLLIVYTKFQIDISKHVEKKSGKLRRTSGRTDRRSGGQTDGHCHGTIRPFFKRVYKKCLTTQICPSHLGDSYLYT